MGPRTMRGASGAGSPLAAADRAVASSPDFDSTEGDADRASEHESTVTAIATVVIALRMGSPPLDVTIELFDLGEPALQRGAEHLEPSERDLDSRRMVLGRRHLPFVEGVQEQDVVVALVALTDERVRFAEAGTGTLDVSELVVGLAQVAPGQRFLAAMPTGPRFFERRPEQPDALANLAHRHVVGTDVDPHAHRLVQVAARLVEPRRLAEALGRLVVTALLVQHLPQNVQGHDGHAVEPRDPRQLEGPARLELGQKPLALLRVDARERDQGAGAQRRGQIVDLSQRV